MPRPTLTVDFEGRPLDLEVDDAWGPATLVVAPVTDALKRLDDGVVAGEVDRDTLVQVVGFALGSEVEELLGETRPTGVDLYEAVTSLGFEWERREHPTQHVPGAG